MNPRVLGPNAGAALCTCRATTNQISAQDAPSNSGSFDCGILFPVGLEGARRTLTYKSVRLSATDISALASMKNVAKCDTWCELQNPVNHRVFERKLRPRPFGRGHICLGVKQLVSRRLPPCRLRARSLSENEGRLGGVWPSVCLQRMRLAEKPGPWAACGSTSGGCALARPRLSARCAVRFSIARQVPNAIETSNPRIDSNCNPKSGGTTRRA